MNKNASVAPRTVFGVTAVLTEIEAMNLLRDLTELWRLSYGSEPADLLTDLDLCKQFFDPLARGQTLRDRLSRLPPTPAPLFRLLKGVGPPLVLDAGEETLILGVEARLLIDLIGECLVGDDHVVIAPAKVAAVERIALGKYREWNNARLNQVIDLRNGRGREVMQSIAVGLVLALLVNRSDSPERAVAHEDQTTPEGKKINIALYAGAERFASVISSSRKGRSQGEQRLKGGYQLSEARRRLAHRITVTRGSVVAQPRVYIEPSYRQEVIEFLGRDLARRPSLSEESLAVAYDDLVRTFRDSAGGLAHRSMVFERASDTGDLREAVLRSFVKARNGEN